MTKEKQTAKTTNTRTSIIDFRNGAGYNSIKVDPETGRVSPTDKTKSPKTSIVGLFPQPEQKEQDKQKQ
jgi:hypothetical protein